MQILATGPPRKSQRYCSLTWTKYWYWVDSLEKDSDAGRDWGQEEKGTTEDEMAGCHHWLMTWVSVNSGSWWWTGRPGVLRFMGSQRVGHHWAIELNWYYFYNVYLYYFKVHTFRDKMAVFTSSKGLSKVWIHRGSEDLPTTCLNCFCLCFILCRVLNLDKSFGKLTICFY